MTRNIGNLTRGLSPCEVLRLVVTLLLMMTLGVSGVKAQTVDYSGTYYIGSNGYDGTPANTNNYYLCPTEGWAFFVSDDTNPGTVQADDNGKPFLTTYQCRTNNYHYGDPTAALWTIEKASNSNYYYIRQTKTGRYIVSNGPVSSNPDRARIHLETIADPNDLDDKALFDIYLYNGHIVIKPIGITDGTSSAHSDHDKHKWLTVNQGNFNQLDGNKKKTDGPSAFQNTGGIICLYTENDARGDFYLEEIVSRPTISYDSENNQIDITHSGENVTIYYTTNGTNPTPTNYAGTGNEITNVTSAVTIKAIAAILQEGMVLPKLSPVSEIRVVPSASITLASSTLTYNGGEQTIDVSSVKDGETVIPTTEYTVSYSNNTNAGNTATVTITDNDGGNYIVYGSTTFTINPKPLTITANPKTITYGDAPANDGVTYGEFAGEETESVLTGTLTYSYNYEQYGDAGSYTITPSGLSNCNYDITFVPGTLTVNPKEVTVTSGITASDKSYDGTTDATLNGTTAVIEGKIGSDDLTVVSGMGTFEDKDVGTDKTVTINSFTFGGAKAGNYQMAASGHQATAQASITPAALSVTAEAKSKTFGDADPEFTYTSDGLIGEDAITGLLSRAEGENVGTYAITQGTLTAGGNYSITLISANLTISPKTIGDGNNAADGITIQMSSAGELETVKDGETTLLENTDYTQEITEDGQDKLVIVTGMGNYTGSAKGIYAQPVFTDPDGEGAGKAAAVYKAKRDMAKPSGIKPYIVRKVNPTIGTLTISEIDYIPEDVPVLLLSDEESEGFTAAPKEEATAAITAQTKNSNLLKVAPKDGVKVEAAQIYTFYQGEFVLTKAGTLSAGKFYLYNPNYTATSSAEEEQQQGGGNAPSLSTLRFVIEEESTGVSDVRSKMEDVRGDWYTLDGRKLSGKPTKAGLYIKNGRKTVIKRK